MDDNNKSRKAAPKRVSLGPVIEPLHAYSFPEESKEVKAQKVCISFSGSSIF